VPATQSDRRGTFLASFDGTRWFVKQSHQECRDRFVHGGLPCGAVNTIRFVE
jgi:hypothetical protein